jgi:hypothetical protein
MHDELLTETLVFYTIQYKHHQAVHFEDLTLPSKTRINKIQVKNYSYFSISDIY